MVKGDGYKIFVYVPDGYIPVSGEVKDGILTVMPDDSENREVEWQIPFTRR